jgi:electron transfer flavoprotein alpha/beta subunit
MRIAVAFDLDGDAESAVRAAAVARTLAPPDAIQAVCATAGPVTPAKTRLAALGLPRAAIVCHPALSDAGVRSRGTVLAALIRHVGADVVLFGLPAVEDVAGLLPAVVAQALGVPGIFRLSELGADAADPGALVVTLRLGGQRRRLRLRPPAVLSLLAGAVTAAPAAAPVPVQLATYDLAQLGFDPRTLPDDVDAAATFTELARKPTVVADLPRLIPGR